jgi:hypothetical protein
VQDGVVSVDTNSTSLIDRVRMTPKETFWRRLLIWSAALTLVSVACLLLIPQPLKTPGLLALMSLFVLASGAGLGACVYCFTRFIFGRELKFLLAATGFFALAGGAALQAITDFQAPSPWPRDWLITASWFVGSIFFAGAAFSESTWGRANRRQAISQLVVGLTLVVAFPLSALPYALDTNLLNALCVTATGALACYVVELVALILAPILITTALFGYYRRMFADGDRFAGLICYFLVACIVGLIYRAASGTRFDGCWATSQVLFATGWIVLVMTIEVESAFAHKEACERLEQLEALHEVSWSLVGAGTIYELLDTFVQTLIDKFGAKIAGVYVADESAENLELAAVRGLDDLGRLLGTRYAVSSEDRRPGFHTGHTAKAFKSQEVHVADDVFVDVEFVPWRVIAADQGCAASIPLVHQGRAFGVLNIYFAQSRELTRQRLRLLTTIAASATPAIENALVREISARDQEQALKLAA